MLSCCECTKLKEYIYRIFIGIYHSQLKNDNLSLGWDFQLLKTTNTVTLRMETSRIFTRMCKRVVAILLTRGKHFYAGVISLS